MAGEIVGSECAELSGFRIERTGWSHVHDANDPNPLPVKPPRC